MSIYFSTLSLENLVDTEWTITVRIFSAQTYIFTLFWNEYVLLNNRGNEEGYNSGTFSLPLTTDELDSATCNFIFTTEWVGESKRDTYAGDFCQFIRFFYKTVQQHCISAPYLEIGKKEFCRESEKIISSVCAATYTTLVLHGYLHDKSEVVCDIMKIENKTNNIFPDPLFL